LPPKYPWLISLFGEGDEALFQGVPAVRPAAGSLSTRVWERAGGHELSWACRPAAADKSLVDFTSHGFVELAAERVCRVCTLGVHMPDMLTCMCHVSYVYA